MDLTKVLPVIESEVPIIAKYLQQHFEPSEAQQITAVVIEVLQKAEPIGDTVTDQQLYDAIKRLINGVVDALPNGKAKNITAEIAKDLELIGDKLTGETNELWIALFTQLAASLVRLKHLIKG
jgi:hypothetical protein